MSIPKFKRKPNGLEYVDNAYVIQVETLRIVSMANSVNPVRYEDILLRKVLLLFSKCCMDVLDKKLKKINNKEIDDDKKIDLLVSKFVKKMIFDNF